MVNNLFNIDLLVRPNIRTLQPYRCARDDFDSGLLLDANENPHGPTVKSISKQESELELNRYPDPYQVKLKQAIKHFRNLSGNVSIFTGVGSDEAIDLLMRVFCVPGKDSILICPPTYGMYNVSACINDLGIASVPLTDDFQISVDDVIQSAKENHHIKLIFFCSPGNPTGTSLDRRDILKVVDNVNALVVVDEAYIDFSDQPSLLPDVEAHDNLVVLQTFSKAFGLAGIRVGIAYGSERVIHYMNAVKAPYNISSISSDIAKRALSTESLVNFKCIVSEIKSERKRLEEELLKFDNVEKIRGGTDANFLLIKLCQLKDEGSLNDHVKSFYMDLATDLNSPVIVRFRGNEPKCEGCIRVSVGTRRENDLLIQQWKHYLGKIINNK